MKNQNLTKEEEEDHFMEKRSTYKICFKHKQLRSKQKHYNCMAVKKKFGFYLKSICGGKSYSNPYNLYLQSMMETKSS